MLSNALLTYFEGSLFPHVLWTGQYREVVMVGTVIFVPENRRQYEKDSVQLADPFISPSCHLLLSKFRSVNSKIIVASVSCVCFDTDHVVIMKMTAGCNEGLREEPSDKCLYLPLP